MTEQICCMCQLDLTNLPAFYKQSHEDLWICESCDLDCEDHLKKNMDNIRIAEKILFDRLHRLEKDNKERGN